MATHRLKAFYGDKKFHWYWNCQSEEDATKTMNGIMATGIVTTTAAGTKRIIPPWQITRFEISPIRRRRKRVVPSTGEIAQSVLRGLDN